MPTYVSRMYLHWKYIFNFYVRSRPNTLKLNKRDHMRSHTRAAFRRLLMTIEIRVFNF